MTSHREFKAWVEVKDSPGTYVRKTSPSVHDAKQVLEKSEQRKLDAAFEEFGETMAELKAEMRRRHG